MFLAVLPRHQIITPLASDADILALAFVFSHLVSITAKRTSFLPYDVVILILLRLGATAGDRGLLADSQVLLYKSILCDCLAACALNVSYVLVADATMAFQVPDAHVLLADRALDLSVIAVRVVVQLKDSVGDTHPAFNVKTHEGQAIK